MSELENLQLRLAAAKRRALYWSGNPATRGGKRYVPRNNRTRSRGDRNEQYERALCDIDALCSSIEAITGTPEPRYDPRAAFRKKWFEVMEIIQKVRRNKS